MTIIVKNLKRLPELSPRVHETICRLILATNDPAFALQHLGKFVAIGVINPFITLLASAAARDGSHASLDVAVDAEALRQILETKQSEAYGLVRTLVEVSPAAMASFVKLVQADQGLLQVPELLGTFAAVLELPAALDSASFGPLVTTAVETMSLPKLSKEMETATKRALRRLAEVVPDTVNQAVCGGSSATFTPATARLARALAKNDNMGQAVSHLVSIGLRYLTRLCSSDANLDDSHFSIFDQLSKSAATDVSLPRS